MITLNKIKVGKSYEFGMYYNGGAGSGSEGRYNVIGEVKSITPEFIRLIPQRNIKVGNRQSIKLNNRSITEVKAIITTA